MTDPWPVVESGRVAAKAVVGEQVLVRVTAFREGHGSLGVEVVLRDPSGRERSRQRMRDLGTGVDVWGADVVPDDPGPWSFSFEAWDDPWGTWWHRAGIKVPAGVDMEVELEEGARLIESIPGDRARLDDIARTVRDTELPPEVRLAAAGDPDGWHSSDRGTSSSLAARAHAAVH
jgi:starch synthase (maltosyl-transferring)